MKNSQNIKDEFFIIESDNLDDVNTKTYGYTIYEEKVSTDFSEKSTLTGNGVYVNVTNDSGEIIISQDFYGSYGLYLYKNSDYFALSNSFLKLEEFIKEKQVLTLNEEYSKTFLSSEFNISFDETLINEITLIPKDYKIIINKNNKKIHLERINYHEKSIQLDTKEGINCLDNWYNKWINIFRNLIKQTNNITIKLDGTISSRILLSIILNSNVDLKNVNIISNVDDEKNTKAISELSNLTKLNIKQEYDEEINDIEKSMDNSYYTKLGINKQISLKNHSKETKYILDDPTPFSHTFKNKTLEELQEIYVDNAKYYSKEYGQIAENFSWNNIHKLQKHIKNYDIYSREFLESIYNHIILRNTQGKNNVENYLSNKITLNPLLDTELQKLTFNDETINYQQLLYTLILSRYNPELLNIKFTDEKINQEITDCIKQINNQFTLKKQDYEFIEHSQNNTDQKVNQKTDQIEYDTLITKIFFSNTFKHTFLKYYSNNVYNQIIKKYTEKNNYSTDDINATIAIVKIINDTEYSQNNTFNTELNWLQTFITQDNVNQNNIPTNHLLNKYNTARIDMKNQGTPSNQIKILNISDESSKITMPSWFTNEKGAGICVSSDKSELSLKIKCINDGNLDLDLRTLDIRDRNNKRFPVYIDYYSFKVDNQELLKENKLTWHDKPIHYSRKVYNNEIITIELKWKPFSNMSKYEK